MVEVKAGIIIDIRSKIGEGVEHLFIFVNPFIKELLLLRNLFIPFHKYNYKYSYL